MGNWFQRYKLLKKQKKLSGLFGLKTVFAKLRVPTSFCLITSQISSELTLPKEISSIGDFGQFCSALKAPELREIDYFSRPDGKNNMCYLHKSATNHNHCCSPELFSSGLDGVKASRDNILNKFITNIFCLYFDVFIWKQSKHLVWNGIYNFKTMSNM